MRIERVLSVIQFLFRDHELGLKDLGTKILLFGNLISPVCCCCLGEGMFIFYMQRHALSEVLSLEDTR